MSASTSRDLGRQIGVLAATTFMIVGAAVGSGAFGGTSVEDLQDGALDTDGSYLAPAGPAFAIWSLIYLGLIAYAIWQALPRQRISSRQRAIGWWIALTEVLNGLWLVTAQFATLPLTVLVIFLLLAALAVTFQRTVAIPATTWPERILMDGVTGLHLGWVTLASVANTSAWLTRTVPESWGDAASAWAIGVLIVVAVIGLGIAWASGWRFAPALALAWGLCWLAVSRTAGEPTSVPIGVVAVIVAVVVALPPLTVSGLRLLRPSVD